MFGITLRQLPRPAKLMITGYLLAIGLGYVYALGNVAMVVGLSHEDIATHYYGNEATQAAMKAEAEAAAAPKVAAGEAVEEELDLDLGGDEAAAAAEEPAAPEEEILAIPSFKSLVGEGHFHLFGMTSFFFGLALIALFLQVSEWRKTVLVTTPFVGIVADNLSLLATRFLGPGWAFLTAASGALMGLAFLGIFVHAMYDLWIAREKPAPQPVMETSHAPA